MHFSHREGCYQLLDNLTGKNKSLLEEYEVFKNNKINAGIDFCEEAVEVSCITLDDFLLQSQLSTPSLIKIDVEGSELDILKGMKNTLLEKKDTVLMVEVSENYQEVFSLLRDAGFQMFTPNKKPIECPTDISDQEHCRNIFCVRGDNDRSSVFTSQNEEAS